MNKYIDFDDKIKNEKNTKNVNFIVDNIKLLC